MVVKLEFLTREDPGWDRAWQAIADEFGSYDCRNAEYSESWQYMGTVIEGEGGRHQFRHRALPPTNARRSVEYPVKPGDFLPR